MQEEQERLEKLQRDGAIAWDEVKLSKKARDKLCALVDAAKSKNKRAPCHTARTAYPLATSSVPRWLWRELFLKSKGLLEIVRGYFKGEEPIVRGLEAIEVLPESPEQILHRDHDEGARACLLLGFSLEESEDKGLGTRFVKGSHLRPDEDEFDVQDIFTLQDATAMLLDPFTVHGGGASKKGGLYRFFLRFENASLAPQSLTRLRQSGSLARMRSISTAALLL